MATKWSNGQRPRDDDDYDDDDDTVLPQVIVTNGYIRGPERRSGARKFMPEAFRRQNYWISQPEPMFLGPAS